MSVTIPLTDEVRAWLDRARYTGPPIRLTKWEAYVNGFVDEEPSDQEAGEPSRVSLGPPSEKGESDGLK